MSGEPDSLVLVYLRRIDIKVDRLQDDVTDLKRRTTALDIQVAGISRRLDRMDERLDRLERRGNTISA